jgi:hypothetical protein
MILGLHTGRQSCCQRLYRRKSIKVESIPSFERFGDTFKVDDEVEPAAKPEYDSRAVQLWAVCIGTFFDDTQDDNKTRASINAISNS